MSLKLTMLIQCSLMPLADVNEPIELIEIDNVTTDNEEENILFPQATSVSMTPIRSTRSTTHANQLPIIKKVSPQKRKKMKILLRTKIRPVLNANSFLITNT